MKRKRKRKIDDFEWDNLQKEGLQQVGCCDTGIRLLYIMKKLHRGLILILMMFGHNYVLNQAQALQPEIQALHSVNVPEFNLLYSVPSAVSILLIIPLGILYDSYSQSILLLSAVMLLIGQLIVTIFCPIVSPHSYFFLILGRTLEGNGAEVLYMIQGNLASSWMGSFAGLTFILPEIGEIVNAFLTPIVSQKLGIEPALIIGFLTCLVSFGACLFLYVHLAKNKKRKDRLQIMTEPDRDSHMEDDLPSTDLQVTDKDQRYSQILQTEEQRSNTEVNLALEKGRRSGVAIPEGGKESQKCKDSFCVAQEALPTEIMKAGQIYWLMIALCAVNECLYFPFLDNANILIQTRFCVPYEDTGFYLCLPFISAITLTALLGKGVLEKYQRQTMVFWASLLPLCGHLVIYFNTNCDKKSNFQESLFLVLGLSLFGMGLGAYYSISFPAVGLAVPESIRGTAYACLCFFQTLSMTAVPIVSGYIIEEDSANDDNFLLGYKNSSFLFICLCLLGVLISFMVMKRATKWSFQYNDEQINEQAEAEEDLQRLSGPLPTPSASS